MKLTKTISFLFILITLSCSPKPFVQTDNDFIDPLSIVQGVSSNNMAQFAILAPKTETYSYRVDSIKPTTRKTIVRNFSNWKIDQVIFMGLEKGKTYTLQVLNEDNQLIDKRSFQTLDLKKPKVKFILASCMDDSLQERQKIMWRDIISQKPEILFLIGDNVYVDKDLGYTKNLPNDEFYWNRYVKTRNSLDIFKAPHLIPIFATWDDHDYGKNNGDYTFKFKTEATKVFEAFFPRASIPGVYNKGPGVSASFNAFNQKFIFLDNRTFRTPKKGEDKVKTQWGQKQEKWVNTILNKNSTPTWLIQGDQFFGKYHPFESYEGERPNSFKRMLSKVKKSKSPVVFASGDRHCAEVMKIEASELGYTTYELTSSGLHAKHYPGQWKGDTANPRQIAGEDTQDNYMLIQAEATNSNLNFQVTAFGPNKKILFQKDLKVSK